MAKYATMPLIDKILSLLDSAGTNSSVLEDRNTAHIVADGQNLLSTQAIPGVTIDIKERPDITIAGITIAGEARVANPIHFCFGMLQRIGTQNFRITIKLEPHAHASFLAHGLFSNVEFARHIMDQYVEIDEGANMRFTDSHFHGISGGIEVATTGKVKVGKQARYISDFSLTTGRVGKLDLKYSVQADDHAVVELTSRVFGHASDIIKINEDVRLDGLFSRSLIKSRVALEGEARAEIIGTTEGRAEGARGHMDCMEIIKDQAVGQSTPSVKVSHPLAKITHEAAIGTVDKQQLETLIAHGLSPEQAVDAIVLGILR